MMNSSRSVRDYFNKATSQSVDAKKLEEDIELVKAQSRQVYWDVLKLSETEEDIRDVHSGFVGVLSTASLTLDIASKALAASKNQKSIEKEESGQTELHILNLGGDSVDLNSIAGLFYQNNNVMDVFLLEDGNAHNEINVYLVLNEEVEDMDLHLATLQNKINKTHSDLYIEIEYSISTNTDIEHLEQDYARVPRR